MGNVVSRCSGFRTRGRISCTVMHDARDRTDPAIGTNAPRSFVDAEGVRWRVYERQVDDYDRRSGMSLIFASEGAVRRVRNFPADWSSLSDQALIALSWKS